jgi:hypothetical protein
MKNKLEARIAIMDDEIIVCQRLQKGPGEGEVVRLEYLPRTSLKSQRKKYDLAKK